MVMFHSYVGLPEGRYKELVYQSLVRFIVYNFMFTGDTTGYLMDVNGAYKPRKITGEPPWDSTKVS